MASLRLLLNYSSHPLTRVISPSPIAVRNALLTMANSTIPRRSDLESKALALIAYLAHRMEALTEDVGLPMLCDDERLHSHNDVFFNDLGSRATLVTLPDHAWRTHSYITEHHARAFGLRLLSSLHIREDVDDEDMGEALTNRIAGALRQYTRDQIFTEFLANAIDAGSNTMDIMLDEKTSPKVALLSPSMAQFQHLPALVFHNASIFSEKDFRGIKRIGMGSKRSLEGKIGRFGLGTLSAYHFSEVSVIVWETEAC